MSNVFNIDPATNLLEVLGHTGYSFDEAIADLIDNSIYAQATKIIIYFNYSVTKPYIYIMDNGKGMELDKLKEAAVIGFRSIYEDRDIGDLGRYSTGLKSATKSFADDIIIASKVNGKLNAIELDYDHIKISNKWEAFHLDSFELESQIPYNGTMIYCTKLLKNLKNDSELFQMIDSLKENLSHIFGKYLLSNKLRIILKTNSSKEIEIFGWDPFSLKKDNTVKVIYNDNITFKKSKISIKTHIFEPFNNLSKENQQYVMGKGLVEQQGFYIYRNDRLIQEGGWLDLPGLKLDDKSKYCRIEMKIPSNLDEDFNVNFSKTSIKIPIELENTLLKIAKQGRASSCNNFNYKRNKIIPKIKKDKGEKIWLSKNTSSGLVININEKHPFIQKFCCEMSEVNKRKLFDLINNTLPINMIQSQSIVSHDYTHEELIEMMMDYYNEKITKGIDKKEIISQLQVLDPFKNYGNSLLIDFIDKLEEE